MAVHVTNILKEKSNSIGDVSFQEILLAKHRCFFNKE